MDWEANLAAVIKCTDASLEQQFRQFADLTGDLTTYSSYNQPSSNNVEVSGLMGGFGAQQSSLYEDSTSGNNIGAAYFRESMASHLKRSGGGEYSAGGGGEYSTGGGGGRASGMPTLFSDDFRKRQEHKRSGEIPNLRSARAASERFNNNEDDHDDGVECEEEFIRGNSNNSHNHHQYSRATRPTRSTSHGVPYNHHMYSSPTYDMAQMMEQVRLSLKLEVDARAAIGERQLSALLNLCKASTEEMDRLRVEVCANDRQIHTLEQVQAKLRQELTTQKDIGFHLQSLCGKDESWRMQAENQLLELRQLVAAIREQGNSLQANSQEKLSRAELSVQFNASIEPVKAQFHANLQHQAQQIAEITRTTSSSSLLLDALTQKVNRGLSDEITDLRNEVYALKSHVAKMNTILDGTRNTQQQEQHAPVAQLTPVIKDPAEESERARQKAKHRADVVEEIKSHVVNTFQDQIDAKTKALESGLELHLGKLVSQQQENVNHQYRKLQSECEERGEALASAVETQIKTLQHHFQSDLNGTTRATNERLEQLKQQMLAAAASLVEAKATACQNRQLDLLKMVESEQKERKTSLDTLQESCRASRHALEDQVYAISHEVRAKAAQMTENIDTKAREIEKSTTNATQTLEKEVQRQLEGVLRELKVQVEGGNERVDSKLRVFEGDLARITHSVASLSIARDNLSTAGEGKTIERASSSVSNSVERETSAYLANMEATLQKMQLQLQLQAQVQAQAQLQAAQVTAQMHPPPIPPYWVSSPHYVQHAAATPPVYASYQQPAAPILAPAPSSSLSGTSMVDTPATEQASVAGLKPEPQQQRTSSIASEAKEPCAGLVEAKIHDSGLKAEVGSAHVTVPAAPIVPTAPATTLVKAVQQPETARATTTKASIPPAAAVENPSPAVAASSVAAGPVDPVEKIQQTIAATAKGALAEAEMAKLRVENRRKQETELRQQQQCESFHTLPEPAVASQPSASISRLLFANAGSVAQKAPESRPIPPSHPQLARAASMSAIPSGVTPPAPTTANSSRLCDSGDQLDDADPKDPSILRPRSNSTSVSGATASLVAQPQQKALASQPPVMAQTGKPPPPPPPNPHSPSLPAPRPALSSTTESKASPSIDLSSPPAPVPPFVSSNPPTSVVRAATVPPASAAVPFNSAPPSAVSIAPAEPKPSTLMGKPPPPSPLAVAKPAAASAGTQLPASPLAQTSSSPASHVLCAMCRLPVRTDQKLEHERSQCSKRTQECAYCHDKVLWSEVDTHEKSCEPLSPKASTPSGQPSTSMHSSSSASDSSASAAGNLKKCRHCNADVASPELFDHELRCDKMLKQCPHCLRRQKMSELQDHIENCDCRLVPCPNDCGGKFLQRGIPKHLATRCPNKSAAGLAVTTTNSSSTTGALASMTASLAQPEAISSPPPPVSSHQQVNSTVKDTIPTSVAAPPPISSTVPPPTKPSTKPPAITSECKFCDEEFPAAEIDDHEDKCDWKPKRCQHCNMVIISRDLLRHEGACKTSSKSCPHCSESLPQSALAAHTARCSKRPIKCIRCCQQFPADSIVAHSTSCKFVPTSVSSTTSSSAASTSFSNAQAGAVASRVSLSTGAAAKIPPPPSYPPTQAPSAAPGRAPAKAVSSGASDATPSAAVLQVKPADIAGGEESMSERMARRNLALSQLTKPTVSVPSSGVAQPSSVSTNATIATGVSGAMRSNAVPGVMGSGPEQDEDHDIDDGEEEEEMDDNDDDEDDDDDEQLTLAQVVAEWNVENVCLWLHEDVGVPEVVPRFQQRRCTGEMLLELSESDLINDFGVKSRIHRERILSAIDAIKTSDNFSDEDDEEEDDEEDEEEEEEDGSEDEHEDANAAQRASRATLNEVSFLHPRDLMRRNTLPSPQCGTALTTTALPLPSSNAMLRRINSALSVEFPNSPKK